MKDEFDKIVKLIVDVYEGKPWYGPSVKSILADVSEEQKSLRNKQSHSLIELVFHMVAWRNFVTQTMEGNLDYQVSDVEDFRSDAEKFSIKEAIDALEMSQVMLLKAISGFDTHKLTEKIPGRKYRYYDLIHGIIHHDVYHAGQISLLKKNT